MKVAFLAAEVAPYAKTGGLGDVVGALPRYLQNRGMDVRIFMPRYGQIQPEREFRHHMPVAMGWGEFEYFLLEEGQHPSGVPIYFLENEGLFGGRFGIYGDQYGEFGDNGYRFTAFCKATLEAFSHMEWIPDIVHAHDWHTGSTMAFLSAALHPQDPRAHVGRIFTIHNQAYQGHQGRSWLDQVGMPQETFHDGGVAQGGVVNLLKTGIQYAHKVTTVSPTYAREICTRSGGFGLQGTMAYRSRDLWGILNGIDTEEWNPQNDPHLDGVSYHAGDLSGKRECKRRLQKEMGLPENDNVLLLGTVSRLVGQKGIELIQDALPTILRRPVQFVVLGSGERAYEDEFRRLAWDYRGRMAAALRFDVGLSHRVEAGVDAFLMPSYYEPCGLNQMYSLRYGTLPIVRHTGGLADTVEDLDDNPYEGYGFHFDAYSSDALVRTVDRALRWYYDDPEGWHWAKVRGMLRDNSWGRSASIYQELYETVLQEKRGRWS
jgi:starch synthase